MSPIRTRKSALALSDIGQVRKGGAKVTKTKDGKQYQVMGPDLGSRFRVIYYQGNEDTMTTFVQEYGSLCPERIVVTLPFNDIDQVWDNWQEAYVAGRMVARTDGEYFEYLVDTKTGERLVVNGLDSKGNKLRWYEGMEVGRDYKDKPIFCKEVGRLKFVVETKDHKRTLGDRMGTMTLMTTSRYDCAHITGQLNGLAEMNRGIISGIPLILGRRIYDITVNIPGSQPSRQPKWLITLEPDPEWVKEMFDARHRLALPGTTLLKLGSGEQVEAHDEALGQPEEAEEEEIPGEEEPKTAHFVPVPQAEAQPEQAPAAEKPWTSTKVSLEMAMSEKSKDGTLYWNMDTETLSTRFNSISEAIKKNHLTPEKREEMDIKQAVVQAIMDYRNQAETEPGQSEIF